MKQSAAKPVDVESAVHILRTACQSHGGDGVTASCSGEVATLLPSAAFLASHCTAALLSSLFEACDAATTVAGVPKRLTMLNAAWKLLLAVASYQDIASGDYEATLVFMVEQLRWGVLSHDWSDKKRVRLATFFASHLVLAVRAHPHLLLTGTRAAQTFLDHLVRLYFAVCITVAVSARDEAALFTLYDNILNRLHTIFDCLGSAAATITAVVRYEGDDGETVASVYAGPKEGERIEQLQGDSSALQGLLSQCVSVAAAADVQEAAGGGQRVSQATATASLGAFLHVVQGIVKKLPQVSSEEEGGAPVAATGGSNRESAGVDDKQKSRIAVADVNTVSSHVRATTLSFLTESLLLWAGCSSALQRTACGGNKQEAATGVEQHSHDAAAAIKSDIQCLSRWLPPNLFTFPSAMSSADVKVGLSSLPSSSAPLPSLRGLWISALASLWQQWITVCITAEKAAINGSGREKSSLLSPKLKRLSGEERFSCNSDDELSNFANFASLSDRLSILVLSSVTCTHRTTCVALMALEAWAELLRRIEIAATFPAASLQPANNHVTATRVLLRVLTNLRYVATDFIYDFLCLSQIGHPCGAKNARGDADDAAQGSTAALILQWTCATIALVGYGESAMEIEIVCTLSDDDDNKRAAANALASQLVEVMKAQGSYSSSSVRKQSDREEGYMPLSAEAAAGFREALLALQQESRKACTQRPPIASGSYAVCRLLIQVPRKLHRVICSFLSTTTGSQPLSQTNDSNLDTSLGQLKQCMLSCSSLLASLTQTLLSLAEISADSEEEDPERESTEVQVRCARVARWVAARLLHEVASVPLTDSADDAVLLACVRRWTDVAFSAPLLNRTNTPKTKAELAQRCGDTVTQADAAASLLRMAEECTTLDLVQLNLSESATAALMDLIEEGSQENEDTKSASQWSALQDEQRRQWLVAEAWVQKQHDAGEAEEVGGVEDVHAGFTAAGKEDGREEQFQPIAHATAPTAADFLRDLQGCEAVLQQLHELASIKRYEVEGRGPVYKRQRLDQCGEDGSFDGQKTVQVSEKDNTCIMHVLSRICELSQSTLVQLELSAGTMDSSLPPPSSSTPTSGNSTVKEKLCLGRADDAVDKVAQVFTLSDTESPGGSRRPSFAEVIDIE